MKVLFLDIDGVLNSSAYMSQPEARDEAPHMLDPEAVRRLDRLMAETGVVVVISSTWRLYLPLTKIQERLRWKGLRTEHANRIIGTTCLLHRQKMSGPSVPRGDEIQRWLDVFPEGVIESFVILDDNSDMGDLLGRLVKVDGDVGLTDENVNDVKTLLGVFR